MSILEKLASALGRKDQAPNLELASSIVKEENVTGIKDLIEGLKHKDKNIQNDCIKVLYEIGALKPQLIVSYRQTFLDLLNHKNNRLQWGGMTALDTLLEIDAANIYPHLTNILAVADKGSVITRDHAVNMLIKFSAIPQYQETAIDLLIEQLLQTPPNQLPMYAERSLPIITSANKQVFSQVLQKRIADIEKASKRRRVEKVLRKIEEMKS